MAGPGDLSPVDLAAFQHRGVSLLLYVLVPLAYILVDRTRIYRSVEE